MAPRILSANERLVKAARAFLNAFDAGEEDQADWTQRFQSALSNLRGATRTAEVSGAAEQPDQHRP